MINHLQILLDLYPDAPWDYRQLSKNPNVTWRYIIAHSDKPWDWYGISKNASITLDIIENNPCAPWDWNGVSKNPNLTWPFIRNNRKRPWNWNYLSKHRNITMKIIKNNPHRQWNYEYMCANPNATWEDICNNQRKGISLKYILKNPNISIDKLLSLHKNYFIAPYAISNHPKLTIQDVIRQKDKRPYLNMSIITYHNNITLDDIKNKSQVQWVPWKLQANPNISYDIIAQEYELDHYCLSLNPNITARIVRDSIEQKWNWNNLSKNKFGKHINLRVKRHAKHWLYVLRRNKIERAKYKILYDTVIDIYKLRLRDIGAGVRQSLL